MKKKVLMSIVLLAIIGTSAIFAQQPTLDKLKWGNVVGNKQGVGPAYASISGALVIPGTYNGNPVQASGFRDCTQITSVTMLDGAAGITSNAFSVGTFQGCTSLTSVTLPASVAEIGGNAFKDCDKLTSVTFGGNTIANFWDSAFPGDLVKVYKSGAGGAGTYTRSAGGTTWTKQGGGFTLNGTWTRSDGMKITIAENGQNITITGDKPNNGGKLNDTYRKQ